MNWEPDRSSGGPVPLRYFVIDGDNLVTPSGRDRPVRWDRHTGQMIVDPKENSMQQMHAREGGAGGPDRFALTKGKIGEITAGGKKFNGYRGVQGSVHNLLAAQGRLFVVTNEGSIYCFGPQPLENPKTFKDKSAPLESADDTGKAFAANVLSKTSGPIGYCLVLGAGTGRLAEELVLQSQYKIVVVDPDPAKVQALRRKFDAAGVYGIRISVQTGDPLKAGLPPYMARLIVSADPTAALTQSPAEFARKVVFSLRPYGGIAVLELPEVVHRTIADVVHASYSGTVTVERSGGLTLLKRPGALPGSANVRGNSLTSDDLRVKGPMGVLWYGSELDWVDMEDVFYNRHACVRDAKKRGWDQGRPYADDIIDGEIRIYGPVHVTCVDAYTGLVLRKVDKGYVPWHEGGGLPPSWLWVRYPAYYRWRMIPGLATNNHPFAFREGVWNAPVACSCLTLKREVPQ
jgi:SAM-dependent methyltransferase